MENDIIKSRQWMSAGNAKRSDEAEGGCGVIGLASSVKISGKHIYKSLNQMRNRGNGKGGGIAMVGLDCEQLHVPKEILDTHYLIQIAYLKDCRHDVEKEFLSCFDVYKSEAVSQNQAPLEVKPPEVWRYFCTIKEANLRNFIEEKALWKLEKSKVEDEFIYQNTFKLHKKFYASEGEKQAFVLCHGKNMMVFKIVGYAEEVIDAYNLGEMKAHVWIGHQRYPTKGRVWHPAGAHPFIGVNDCLVHNGDFANYYSVSTYLRQRNIYPLFLTDTEVSALLFDLLSRTYNYPLEYVIEAMAPTTERDFEILPDDKKTAYKALRDAHMHGSPDGPWFFIIARSKGSFDLIGITDTSMLRPQVFALQEGEASIGLIASEKQAIDACLRSISSEDKRFWGKADVYWNARGGSYTDGGAFIFSVADIGGTAVLKCANKFGKTIKPSGKTPYIEKHIDSGFINMLKYDLSQPLQTCFPLFSKRMRDFDYPHIKAFSQACFEYSSQGDEERAKAIQLLAALLDRRFPIGVKKRSYVDAVIEEAINRILDSIKSDSKFARFSERAPDGRMLVLNADEFAVEGEGSLSYAIDTAIKSGWKRLIVYNGKGHRFIGCGIARSDGVRIDVFGNSGDYLSSGLDGAEIRVHGWAQDQVANIMKSGKLVVYGSVGQTFMYGAKGGEAYIMGNTAGRPLINAVGKPRVIINGTALDYLAESFMAGDPLNGGGFVVINGIKVNDDGKIEELETPYPGGNLFSIASGGAIYVRDPHQKLDESQLNGGFFQDFTEKDWELILPYLKENERLFWVPVEKLLTVNGEVRRPEDVYRKVGAKIPKAAIH